MAEERLWPGEPTPAGPDTSESASIIALGTVFVVGAAGNINGAYIYISDTPPGGTVQLGLFRNGEGLIASKTITVGTGGWERFDFDTPVEMAPGDECIIYYQQTASGGLVRYAFTGDIFTADVDSANLHAPDSTEAAGLGIGIVAGNGVFAYDFDYIGAGDAPANSFNESSYWVDPIFEAAAADGVLSSVGTAAGAFVGSGLADGVFSSSGVATVTFSSDGVLDAAGIATAEFVGALDSPGALSTDGLATAAFVGESGDGALAAAGSSTVLFTSSNPLPGVFGAGGVATATFVGALGERWSSVAGIENTWTREAGAV